MTAEQLDELLREAEAENARLREALEWYADPQNHVTKRRDIFEGSAVHFDEGERARAALEKDRS